MEEAPPGSFYRSFSDALASIVGGKRVATDIYLHLLHPGVDQVLATVPQIQRAVGANVVRFGARRGQPTLSFLSYKDFFDESFPELQWSVHVPLPDGPATRRIEGRNPAILHRKELLLPSDHANYARYEQLSKALEANRLLPASSFVGRREHWRSYLASRGFSILDGRLISQEIR